MNKPLVSVIIPVWNGREHLDSCLVALQTQTYAPLEIIAVDNASKDGSAEFIERNFSSVRLIRNRYNLGFAGGCNVGLEAAQGDVLMLLNQDTEVEPNWAQELVKALQEPGVGIVGSKIFYPDGKTIQHAGAWIEWPLGLAHHYNEEQSNTRETENEAHEAENESRSVEYVTGAAIAFRRDVMEQIGLLDEQFWPGYFEDADYCFRVRAAGLDVRYVPTAILKHKETTSISEPSLVSQYYQRGRLRFLLKHLSPERFLTEFVPAEEESQRAAILGRESLPLRRAYLQAIPDAVAILQQVWHSDTETINQVIKALQRLHQLAWAKDWERLEYILGPIAPTFADLSPTSVAPFEIHSPAIKLPEVRLPTLKPLEEFRSSLPVIGPLVSRFRSVWYNVAARWAIQELIKQQNQIHWTLMQIFNQTISKMFDLQREAILQELDKINRHQTALHHQQQVQNEQKMALNQQHSEQQNRYIEALEEQLRELAGETELLAAEMSKLRLEIEKVKHGKQNECRNT